MKHWTEKDHAAYLVDYCIQKGYTIDREPGMVNIIYIEGLNADWTLNPDKPDFWNDRRLVLMFDYNSQPYLAINHSATTEPGWAATISAKAKKLGGVARIVFGQQTAWKPGFHKSNPLHPALVQCAPVAVFRDLNKDGKRPGDLLTTAAGINQHGTRSGFNRLTVGLFSEGCLVGWKWPSHLAFMRLVNKDVRIQNGKEHVFSTITIAGDDYISSVGRVLLAKEKPSHIRP
jgi:hypothetical protein